MLRTISLLCLSGLTLANPALGQVPGPGAPSSGGELQGSDGGAVSAPLPAFPSPFAPPPVVGQVGPSSSELYQAAYSLMLQQKWEAAAGAFDALIARFPDSVEAPVAGEMSRLAKAWATPNLKLKEPQLGDSRSEPSGRPELLITSSIMGIWSGVVLSVISNFGVASILVSGLTGLAGLGISLWASSGRTISAGGAALISTGFMFGLADGLLLSAALGGFGGDTNLILGMGWVGSAFGMGVTVLLQQYVPITNGQAALVTSGGLLGAALPTLILLGLSGGNSSISGSVVAGTILALNSVGLAAGAIGTRWFHPTRGRVVLTELGGLFGGVVVGGTAALLDNGNGNNNAAAVSVGTTLGMLIGGGIVLYLTGDIGMDEGSVEVPNPIAGARLLPPSLSFNPVRAAGAFPAVGIELLQGTF